jgi:RimJ/RimL family protein N-acetyltransferase
MLINFTPFLPSEINILIDFIISDNWPFHGYPKITPEQIKKNFEEGFYTGDGIETFWIIADGEKAGMIRLYDLEDLTPIFDIRISSSYQGKGIGEKGVKWLTEYVFKTYSHIMRIEGYTREDNLAMRKVFEKCGYVKEAHHRKSWPGPENVYYDSVGYCILREDWEENKITPVKWHDRVF